MDRQSSSLLHNTRYPIIHILYMQNAKPLFVSSYSLYYTGIFSKKAFAFCCSVGFDFFDLHIDITQLKPWIQLAIVFKFRIN
jgi:hypothetical protein